MPRLPVLGSLHVERPMRAVHQGARRRKLESHSRHACRREGGTSCRMSRARNIKPGFFKNDLLAECHPLARILFAGLWCEADRAGRLHDRPNRIKAECLPYDECDVDALLEALRTRAFIIRYVADGVRYISIPGFTKHQNPHIRESASSIPEPGKHSASTVLAEKCTGSAPLIPDSPSLIPDSPSPKKSSLVRQAGRFSEFWASYPNKTGRKPCETKWKASGLDEHADTILAHVEQSARTDRRWLDGFVPNPATYLNQERWKDPIQARRDAPATLSKTAQGIMALERLKDEYRR